MRRSCARLSHGSHRALTWKHFVFGVTTGAWKFASSACSRCATASGSIALPRRQQRALLAALALRAGEVVSTDRLVGDLWGERAPASATGSLQNTVCGPAQGARPRRRVDAGSGLPAGARAGKSRRPPLRTAARRPRWARTRSGAGGASDRGARPLARSCARRPRRGAIRPARRRRGWTSCALPRSRSGSTPSSRSAGMRRSSASSRRWSPLIRFASGCAAS